MESFRIESLGTLAVWSHFKQVKMLTALILVWKKLWKSSLFIYLKCLQILLYSLQLFNFGSYVASG